MVILHDDHGVAGFSRIFDYHAKLVSWYSSVTNHLLRQVVELYVDNHVRGFPFS